MRHGRRPAAPKAKRHAHSYYRRRGLFASESDAPRLIEKLIESNSDGDIYTLGKLIHNKTIPTGSQRTASKSRRRGYTRLVEEAAAGRRISVIIRAHGVRREVEQALTDKVNLNLIDGTCPCVKSIQRLAYEFTETDKYVKDRRLFVLFGDRDHPEIQSVISYAKDGVVVSGADAFAKMCENGEIPATTRLYRRKRGQTH